MKLTKNEVKHIAKLANLKLTEKEIEKFRLQLSSILKYVAILDEINTKDVKPISQVTGLENVFRDDEKGACLSQEEVLCCAGRIKDGYFKVDKIFD